MKPNASEVIIIIATAVILVQIISFIVPGQNGNPYYKHNEFLATEIFHQYNLGNCTSIRNNECPEQYAVSHAFIDLCEKSGNWDGHDAMHFWSSNNPEVEKTKQLWEKLQKEK